MLNKILFLFSIGLYGSCMVAFGQWDYKTGYIIENDKDTIWGLVDHRLNADNAQRCVFTTDVNKAPTTFFPHQIVGYSIENEKYFVSKEVMLNDVKDTLFLEYLVNGIVDLYYLALVDHDYYFLEKNGEMYTLSNEKKMIDYKPQSIIEARKYGSGEKFFQNSNKYIGMLSIVFSDCPDLQSRINNLDFNYKQIIEITKDYHNKVCTDYKCIDYSKSTQIKVYAEPYIGLVNSTLLLKTSTQYEKNISYIVGINLRILPLKSNYLWNFLIGINFSQNRLDEEYRNDLETEAGSYGLDLLKADYSVLRIPISVEYALPFKIIKPFLMATYTNAFIINKDIEENWRYKRDTRNILNFGLGMGIGVKYVKGDRGYGILKCEYEHRESYSKSSHIFDYAYANSIIITVGYGFKL